jgi:hypothetical protein
MGKRPVHVEDIGDLLGVVAQHDPKKTSHRLVLSASRADLAQQVEQLLIGMPSRTPA